MTVRRLENGKVELKELLGLERISIREIDPKHVEEIKRTRDATGYQDDIKIVSIQGKEKVFGGTHLLESMRNEDPLKEIWIQRWEADSEVEGINLAHSARRRDRDPLVP